MSNSHNGITAGSVPLVHMKEDDPQVYGKVNENFRRLKNNVEYLLSQKVTVSTSQLTLLRFDLYASDFSKAATTSDWVVLVNNPWPDNWLLAPTFYMRVKQQFQTVAASYSLQFQMGGSGGDTVQVHNKTSTIVSWHVSTVSNMQLPSELYIDSDIGPDTSDQNQFKVRAICDAAQNLSAVANGHAILYIPVYVLDMTTD